MKRLTKKIGDNYCSQAGDFYDLYNKLGQLEDLLEKYHIRDIEHLDRTLEVLDIIKMARKNIEAGRYIDYDNSCLMIKDYKGSVVDWYKLDESKIAKVNEVLNND